MDPMVSCRRARVAELADAPDSKSGGRKAVMVRPHSRAPKFFWKITYGFGTVRPSDSNPPYKYPVFMLLRKIAVSYVANSHCYQLLPINAKIRYRMTHVDTSA